MDGTVLDDRTLRRIIATLVALAVLAERAAARSFPVRCFLLTVLGHAEAVAQAFVVEATQAQWANIEKAPEAGFRPVDALLLALRLRMFAAVLAGLLEPAGRFDEDGACIACVVRRFLSGSCRLPAMPGAATIQPFDTS